jgi:hypothetical protein
MNTQYLVTAAKVSGLRSSWSPRSSLLSSIAFSCTAIPERCLPLGHKVIRVLEEEPLLDQMRQLS